MYGSTLQPLLDAHELAEFLSLANHRAVYKLLETTDIPYVRIGRRVRFDPAAVLRYFEERGDD